MAASRSQEKDVLEHLERLPNGDDSMDSKHDNAEARNATDREHALTLRDSFRLYPKAIAFSLLFSTAIIMEGYDLALMGNFYGYES